VRHKFGLLTVCDDYNGGKMKMWPGLQTYWCIVSVPEASYCRTWRGEWRGLRSTRRLKDTVSRRLAELGIEGKPHFGPMMVENHYGGH
jgi:hypothetical protein